MDQLKSFFTTRTALAMIVVGVLLAGLAGGVSLTQRQTQLESTAAESCVSPGLVSNLRPKNGHVFPAGKQKVTLQWDAPSGGGPVGHYNVRLDDPTTTGSGKEPDVVVDNVTDTSLQVPDLENPTTYNWWVDAVSSCGAPEARASASFSIGVGGAATCPTTSLQNISNEDLIAKCTLAEIALLSNDRLMTFPLSILVQLSNERLEQFTLAFLATFSNERLQQFSLGTLEKLPNERLQLFSIPFLQNFSNDRLITMDLKILAQFPEKRIKTFPCEIQIQLGYTCSGSLTGDDVAGTCEYKLLETKTLSAAKDIISGLQYKLQITMKNTGKSTWGTDTYILKPSTKTISDWGVSPIALKDSLIGQPVAPNKTATFEFIVTGPALKVADQPESRSFSFQMANGASEFGAACETGAIAILPKTAATNATACFILSANQSEVTGAATCNDINAKALGIVHPYPSDPTQLSYKLIDTSAGVKTIYVRFISTKGEIADGFGQITFAPDPTVSAIACTQSATGTGTIVALAGTNFGTHTQQGQGLVTVNGTQAQIVTWDVSNPARNLIQATVPTRLEGSLSIDLKVDDGRTVTGGKCTIGESSVQFTVSNQCVGLNSFNADNIDATIVRNVTGAQPLAQTKISISKGAPQSFVPKLEANKNYSLILKGSRLLTKRVDFTSTSDQGTVNLGNVQMLIGDIAPFSAPDGVINSFDNQEMIRQWSLLSSDGSAKTASLTEHGTSGIVNSLDYSCLKLGIGKQSDDLTLAAPATTTTTTSGSSPPPSSFSSANSFRDYILNTYGFTETAANFIKNNSTITVGQLSGSCNGGGEWIPASKTVQLNCIQHEAALHELSHVWWHTYRLQNPEVVKGLARDLVKLADGDGAATAVAFAKTYVSGDGGSFKGMYCNNGCVADVHNLQDSDFDITESAANAKINDWEIYAGLSSWTMGRFKSGSHALPAYMWKYFDPEFTGTIQITPYYDGGSK